MSIQRAMFKILAPCNKGRTVFEPPWLGPGPGCSQIHVAKTVVLLRRANPDAAGLSGRVCLHIERKARTKVTSKAIAWCFAHFSDVSCRFRSFADFWKITFGLIFDEWNQHLLQYKGAKSVERQRHLCSGKEKNETSWIAWGQLAIVQVESN